MLRGARRLIKKGTIISKDKEDMLKRLSDIGLV